MAQSIPILQLGPSRVLTQGCCAAQLGHPVASAISRPPAPAVYRPGASAVKEAPPSGRRAAAVMAIRTSNASQFLVGAGAAVQRMEEKRDQSLSTPHDQPLLNVREQSWPKFSEFFDKNRKYLDEQHANTSYDKKLSYFPQPTIEVTKAAARIVDELHKTDLRGFALGIYQSTSGKLGVTVSGTHRQLDVEAALQVVVRHIKVQSGNYEGGRPCAASAFPANEDLAGATEVWIGDSNPYARSGDDTGFGSKMKSCSSCRLRFAAKNKLSVLNLLLAKLPPGENGDILKLTTHLAERRRNRLAELEKRQEDERKRADLHRKREENVRNQQRLVPPIGNPKSGRRNK